MVKHTNNTPDDDDLDNPEPSSDEFAALLDSYLSETTDEIRVGDKVGGAIIAIGQDSVYVHIGGKEDGVVEKAELLNEKGELDCRVGDRLELYVVAAGEGEVRLSRAIAAGGQANLLYDAQQNHIPVEGRVSEVCKGGFRVQILGQTAFCPVSQMDVRFIEKPEEYVGAVFEFLVERVESRGRNVIVNRRRHLERLQAEEREKFLARVSPGDVLPGKAVRLMPYGVFFELQPGVEGMAHISELSWSRVADPADVLSLGQTLPVKILTIEEKGGKSGGFKMSLSVKQAAGDPWTAVGEKFKAGDKVTGRVTRCAAFGAFVELAPGIEGLVHISEMSFTRRVVKTEDVVQPGDTVAVMVTAVDPVNRRISLSIREAEGDPWLTVANRLAVGQTVAGVVERVADFGLFVSLMPGVTGLMPRSNMEKAADPRAMEKLKADDPVTVLIEAINLEDRKMTLAPAESNDAGDWKSYAGDRGAGSGLGALGQKLQQAMKSKKV